jgi:catechol 2,3-dioxygenase-like lactoylglutathione lyase family enzyme
MPKIQGLLETALYVDNLERSLSFYKTIFEFKTLFSDDRLCALNISDKQVLLLFLKGSSTVATITPGGIIPPNVGSGELHLALSISMSELDHWKNWLVENGIEIESQVKWTRGGTSIYFRDPDRHLIELATPGLWAIY